MTKILSQILPSFEHKIVNVEGQNILDLSEVNNIPVSSLVFDSRQVQQDSLFFALPGTHVDGNNFIAQSILNGANAVVFQGELTTEQRQDISKAIIKRTIDNQLSDELTKFCPCLINVPDARISMAPLSSCFYDNPSERLIVIGVTGTEGKSSTVSFIWQLLRECGKKAGFISTVEYSLGDEAISNPQHQTTPEAPIIQSQLNKMLENGCEYAVIESSSHGLSKKLNRCGNIAYDCAVFMNVTLEHLEFHKNFETYRSDKANLFRALEKHNHIKTIAGVKQKINSIGIVNLEDTNAEYFASCTTKKIFGFTTNGMAGKLAGNAKISLPSIPENVTVMTAQDINSTSEDLCFNVKSQSSSAHEEQNIPCEFCINSKLPGAFNAYNIMASILAVSSLTQTPFNQLAPKINNLVPIKGRMTEVLEGQDFEVIIDYAHTPSSFETIFPPIKNRCKGKLYAIFGSGGERDLTKRPLQGNIAAQYCDVIILADEDPRGEDPVELLKQIAQGAIEQGKQMNKDLFIIHERPKAIRQAFNMAQKDDIVLLLGKSHENSIIYKDYVMPYDELSEAKKALGELK